MMVPLKRFWSDENKTTNKSTSQGVCPLYCCLFRNAFPSLNFKHHPGDAGYQLEFLISLDRHTTGQTGHWKASYHKWSRNPQSGMMAHFSRPVCACQCVCAQKCASGRHRPGSCHLKGRVLLQGVRLLCAGDNRGTVGKQFPPAGDQRWPTKLGQLPSRHHQSFSPLFGSLLILSHCHRQSSSAAQAPAATPLPLIQEDMNCPAEECDLRRGRCRVAAKCKSIIVFRFSLSSEPINF